MKSSKPQLQAATNYRSKHDIVTTIFPKGTKERIDESGESYGDYIRKAVEMRLNGNGKSRNEILKDYFDFSEHDIDVIKWTAEQTGMSTGDVIREAVAKEIRDSEKYMRQMGLI